MSNLKPDENRYGQYTVPSSDVMVNLGVGQPRNEVLKTPLNFMFDSLSLINKTNESYPNEVLQYGDIPGYYRFRKILCDFLKNYKYNHPQPENIYQTLGATEAVSLITTLFTNNDDLIVVENPTYFLMINIFKELGRNVVGISMEKDGFNRTELENILENNKDRKVLFYGIPFNHNPTGYTWSEDRKMELCSLLDKYENFFVMTDEVYQLLNFDNFIHIPMAEYHSKIMSVGSFSKVIAPAFRIGWIYSKNEDYIKTLKGSASRDSSGSNSLLGSLIVENMLKENQVEIMLNNEKKRLCDNMSYIKDYLDSELNKYFEYELPKGGYFVWLKLKEKYNELSDKMLENMELHRVKFHSGSKFSISKEFKDCIRLSLSFYKKEEILVGLERIKSLMDSLVEPDKTSEYGRIGIFGINGRLGKLIKDEFDWNEIPVESYRNNVEYNYIIDVTSNQGTNDLITNLIKNNSYPVLIIGTTGHDEETKSLMHDYTEEGAIFLLSNFSSGVRMLKDFIKSNKSNMEDYKVDIEEIHHIHKKDKPSGTALSLAKCFDREIDIVSKREGEVFGEHKIVLSNESETITIIHSAKNRNLFAKGCINFLKSIHHMTFDNSLYQD